MRSRTSIMAFVYAALLAALGCSVAGAQGVPKADPSSPKAEKQADARRAIVLLGDPDGNSFGTGWVLSRKHRLVVTNSHVADLYFESNERMTAVVNETRLTYAVTKVWFHPGVRRQIRGEKFLVVRSTDPKEGPTSPTCPDLAVLQLSADGPDLPAEIPMARPEDLRDLQEVAVTIRGYPGADTFGWPKPGEVARATFDKGVIRRLTDFQDSPRENDAENQFVQHSIATMGGFSGSPVMLANGRVVAVHNSGTEGTRPQAFGVRIDCLWELLVHHKLTDKVAVPVEESKIDIARWLKPGPNDARYREAWKLVERADYLRSVEGRPMEAIEKCNEALRLAGVDIYGAYRFRSLAHLGYLNRNVKSMTPEECVERLQAALDDFTHCEKKKLLPENGLTLFVLDKCNLLKNVDHHHGTPRKSAAERLGLADSALKQPTLKDRDRARLLIPRGVALFDLGRDEESLEAFNKAIELAPANFQLLDWRAWYWDQKKEKEKAEADRAKARELREQQKQDQKK